MPMRQWLLAGCACVLLMGCSGEDERQSLREGLARLPQDTTAPIQEDTFLAIEVDTPMTGPQTLPDSVGLLETPSPAPVQRDTTPRLRPGEPTDVRPWIPERRDSLPLAPEWTRDLREDEGDGSRMTVLTSVRTARNDGYDRVVFEFAEGRTPGYRVEPVELPVRQCGSGQAVSLRGDSWIRVRLQPSQAHDDRGHATVPDRSRAPNLPQLRELRLICDYEGQVEWVLGTNAPREFRVTRLQSPARIVVDVRQ